eukprot:gnl/Trimastix_PCT/1531.p1 GENE.gnl/Trimastix_PCT/1531~~gnl/Trimastix_PCT/1531.p1  ORF type:complete len:385 (-),score=123.06 gnl/Trimastix_PCT/1531:79-1233(-)
MQGQHVGDEACYAQITFRVNLKALLHARERLHLTTDAMEPEYDNLEFIISTNEALTRENQLFRSALDRIPPQQLHKENATKGKGSKGAKAKDKTRATLSAVQKVAICQREIEELETDIARTVKRYEKLIEETQALVQATDQYIGDLRKENYEFRRDILMGAQNPRTGKIMAEKFVQYCEARLKAKAALIEKLRLQNTAHHGQYKKYKAQVDQNNETGDTLDEIDYQQLKIENRQYQQKIQQRNDEKFTLKKISGRAVATLNTLKKRLQSLTREGAMMQGEIEARNEQLKKLNTEYNAVKLDRDHAFNLNKILKARNQDGDRPQVLDYIHQKATVHDLEKELRSWQRKLEIASNMQKQRLRRERVRARRAASAASATAELDTLAP